MDELHGTSAIGRRAVLTASVAVPLVISSRAMADVGMARPMRCGDFLDTIGVNTHLRYAKSQYNDADAVVAALRYCGMRHVRDTAISSEAPNAGHYLKLANVGVGFCLFWGVGRTMMDAITQVDRLETAHPGAIDFLEGPNEVQAKFNYAGQMGLAAAQQFMVDVRADAQQRPALRKIPLVSFTSFKPVSSVSDYANHHPYPKNGVQPGALIKLRHDQWVGPEGAMPGKPMVLTEFGYHTLTSSDTRPGHWRGVDEESQATLLLNGWFDAARVGIARTYIYQLFDAAADLSDKPSQENHFGLFRLDGSPKPSATAFRSLSRLLADTSPTARSFPVSAVRERVVSDTAVNVLPLRHSTGRVFFVVWTEPSLQAGGETAAINRVTVDGISHMEAYDAATLRRLTTEISRNGPTVQLGVRPVLLALGA